MAFQPCDIRSAGNVPARVRPALWALFEAHLYAHETSGDLWEFAVEIDQLSAMGLTRNDMRWLVRQQIVYHRREVTLEGENGRAFCPTGDLTFTDRTCFVLTSEGCRVAGQTCRAAAVSESNHTPEMETEVVISKDRCHADVEPPSANGEMARKVVEPPKWDPERRVLCVGGQIVKHFKWTAENQEAILAAFEEEGWPPKIDDPLPPQPEQDSKRRLSDTIKCLNRKQTNQLLHFRGDGTGEGVVWEYLPRNSVSTGELR